MRHLSSLLVAVGLSVAPALSQERSEVLLRFQMPRDANELTIYRNHGQNPREIFRNSMISVCADRDTPRSEVLVQMNNKRQADMVPLFEGSCISLPIADHVYIRRLAVVEDALPVTGTYRID